MNGFQKRVKLLEKWVPSLLPQLKDIDDMADIILDVWDEAEAHTEQRIIKLLEQENNDEMSIDYQNYLIALIKGEVDERIG
jgi:hypothetical protein